MNYMKVYKDQKELEDEEMEELRKYCHAQTNRE
jgi:hypothetical protein